MKINIPQVAKLANLVIKKSEEELLEKQLSSILDYVEKLKKLDTSKTEETSQVTDLENITREDIAKPSLSSDDSISNAKSAYNGLFKVEGILE
ncbi:MAG TPA: Asp-tRNA(Asn)/Glu-tRNA(Gln) amidotransferase subunit GatC [Patescibacteria group bacterium]|nr:Asp-tRNA(Asn)/Glu-tRNA(Gln) amidotransferase subunit GatC [Patescibacteria group bacterium]